MSCTDEFIKLEVYHLRWKNVWCIRERGFGDDGIYYYIGSKDHVSFYLIMDDYVTEEQAIEAMEEIIIRIG